MLLSDLAFTRISGLIRAHSGIHIPRDKASNLASRLRPFLRERGYRDFDDYFETTLKDPTEEALGHLIDRIATNYTYFFREKEHFDFLHHEGLPAAVERLQRVNSRDLRIWSAACSTGEEPYSIRMALGEFFDEDYEHWRAGVLATDISSTALAAASRARFSEQQLDRVPPSLRNKYFERVRDELRPCHFRAEQRKDVVFRRLNLHCAELPFRNRMHIVFCRNVLLYFDPPGKAFLEGRMFDLIEEDGFLVIGLTESLQTGDALFEHVSHGVFRRRRG